MKSLILVLAIFSASSFATLKAGDVAPDFSLKGHDGKTYKLSEMKGNYVVLEWFNNDCPYVDKHYHEDHRNMQKLQEKWIKAGIEKAKAKGEAKKMMKGLQWYAVASSAKGSEGHLTAERATKIKNEERKAKMNAILLDADGVVGKAYKAKVTPHMFIIDPMGKIAYNGAIDSIKSARVKDVPKAKNYVTAALDSLFSSKAVAEPVTKPYGCSVKY